MSGLPVFVSAGEALTDLIRVAPDGWSSRAGGAGLNVARAAARLGLDSAFAGAVSRDVFGDALFDAARQAQLDLRFLQRSDHSPLLAIVHEHSPPRYFFVGDDSADLQFDPSALPSGWQRAARWVHFGGISLARQPLAARLLALAGQLKAQGVRISYDPNFRVLMDERYDAMRDAMGRLADVIKVSDDDLCGLYRTGNAEAALTRLRDSFPQAACLVTRGPAGATLYQGGRGWHAPAPAITVADTIGAGDASAAALLYSLISRPAADPAEHLRLAVAAGAAACTRAGATPPSLAEVQSLLPAVAVVSIIKEY